MSSSNDASNNANIQSAVTFLRDPSVQSSTLARKVAFLEAKGLSSSDIDTAIRIASSSQANVEPGPQQQQQQRYGFQQQGYPDYRQGQQQQWERLGPTWKDWFIVATIGGAAGTLLYSLARKYLVPALSPPSSTELTSVQDALTAKYDEAASILASLQQETAHIKSTLQEECEKIDGSVEEIESALKVIKEKEESRELEFRNVKEEVDGLKTLMERMFDKHKEAQTTSLNDIQQEVKSLKSLLVRRNVASDPSSSSSTTPGSSSTTSILPAPTSLSASDSTPTATPGAPSASSSQPQASTSLYGRPQSPYAYGGAASRFGISSSRSASSSSIADIANRPPGIPAWQLAASSSQPSTSSSNTTMANGDDSKIASATEAGKKDAEKAMEDSTAGLNGSASEYEEVKKPEDAESSAEITA